MQVFCWVHHIVEQGYTRRDPLDKNLILEHSPIVKCKTNVCRQIRIFRLKISVWAFQITIHWYTVKDNGL